MVPLFFFEKKSKNSLQIFQYGAEKFFFFKNSAEHLKAGLHFVN